MQRSADIVRSDLSKSSKSWRTFPSLSPDWRSIRTFQLPSTKTRFLQQPSLVQQTACEIMKNFHREVLRKYLLNCIKLCQQFCFVIFSPLLSQRWHPLYFWVFFDGPLGETIIKKWLERANARVLGQFQTWAGGQPGEKKNSIMRRISKPSKLKSSWQWT